MATEAGAAAPARARRSTTLPAATATAAAARAFVVASLRSWRIGTDTLDDAELVVSELVTNACLHGHAAEVAIALADHGPSVRIEVAHHEDGPAAAEVLAPLTAGADDTHGRGLAIVDVLSRAWGVDEAGGTRRVWAQLAAVRVGLVDAGERDGAVAALTAVTAEATTVRALGAVVTAWARERLEASFAGVALVEPDGSHLAYLSLDPLPEASAAAWARFPVDTDAPVAAAFREGQPFFHESRAAAVAGFPDLGPALAQAQVSALVHLPLCAAAVPIGTLALAWEHGRELDGPDRHWLVEVAEVVAAAFVRLGVTGPGATAPGATRPGD